jgi:hypothetical protein
MTPKYIEYDGLKFCRDDKTGYYLNSTIHERLHRYVWQKEVGKIPNGYHIHHIDGNKANNSLDNLALVTASGHERLHGTEQARKEIAKQNIEKARPYAIQWHKSEAGRKWHSEHATGQKAPRTTKTCEVCGKEYQGTKVQRFCSNACKSKWRRVNELDCITIKCEICGKEIKTNRFKPQKYCSKACAAKGHVGWFERKQL